MEESFHMEKMERKDKKERMEKEERKWNAGEEEDIKGKLNGGESQ